MKKFRTLGLVCVSLVIAGMAFGNMTKEPDVQPVGPGTVASLTGGPNDWGYVFSDQDDGCTYQYIDITGTGVDLVEYYGGYGDDDEYEWTLGGPGFPFYGVDIVDVVASTNGFLSVEWTDYITLSNACPLSGYTLGGIAVNWDDLDMGNNPADGLFHEYFAACPRPPAIGCNVFQWFGDHYSTSPDTDIEMILYDNGDIVLQVALAGEGGSSSTTGILNVGGTDALEYACNTAGSLIDGVTAVCYTQPPRGACCTCLPAPYNCTQEEPDFCLELNGEYMGDDVECLDDLGEPICPDAPVEPSSFGRMRGNF